MDREGIVTRLEVLKNEVSKDMPESHSSLIIRGIELSIAEIIKENGFNFDSETWLNQVELIQQGKFPKKTAREFLDEQRKEQIRALANKAANRNDEALKKLDDNLKLDYDVRTKEENEQYNKENEEFWKGK